MSFTVNPAAARPFSKRSLFIMFHIGRAGRGLSLPTQEIDQDVVLRRLDDEACTHSTSRPLTGSMNVGCNQERFSSRSSLVSVGKKFEDVEEGPLLLVGHGG